MRVWCISHTVQEYTVHCTVCSVQCILYIVQRKRTLHSVQFTLYSVQRTVYVIQYTMYIVQCTAYSVRYTLYTEHCTLYIVYYTVYRVNVRHKRTLHTVIKMSCNGYIT